MKKIFQTIVFLSLLAIGSLGWTDEGSFSPSVGGDDGFWYLQGVTEKFYYHYDFIRFGNFSTYEYNFFVRFPNVTIPQGATIDEAYVTFRSNDTSSNGTCRGTIYFNDADNASAPTTYSEAEGKDLTTESVAWAEDTGWINDRYYDTPELKDVVQEVVDRESWSSGNAMMLMVKSDGANVKARTMDGVEEYGEYYAVLHVIWTEDMRGWSAHLHLVDGFSALEEATCDALSWPSIENLWDNDVETSFNPNLGYGFPVNIDFEFSEAYRIEDIHVFNDNDHTDRNLKTFDVKISSDGLEWETVASDVSIGEVLGDVDVKFSNPSGCKYYRITCTENYGYEDFMEIGEIHFRIPSDACDFRVNDQLLTHTSGSFLNGAVEYPSDENIFSYWQARPSYGTPWWKVDFGVDNYPIVTTVEIQAGTSTDRTMSSFKIYGSYNDSDWVQLYSGGMLANLDLQTFEFTNTEPFRYYKIDDITVPAEDLVNLPTIHFFTDSESDEDPPDTMGIAVSEVMGVAGGAIMGVE